MSVGRCLIYVSDSYRELFPLFALGYAVDFPTDSIQHQLLRAICRFALDAVISDLRTKTTAIATKQWNTDLII